MHAVSSLSLSLVLGATAAAAGIEVARRFATSRQEIAAVRATTARLSERLVEHERNVRDHQREAAHTVRNMEIRLGQSVREASKAA